MNLPPYQLFLALIDRVTGIRWINTRCNRYKQQDTAGIFTSYATQKQNFQLVFFLFYPSAVLKTMADNWYFLLLLPVKTIKNHHTQRVQHTYIPVKYGDFGL